MKRKLKFAFFFLICLLQTLTGNSQAIDSHLPLDPGSLYYVDARVMDSNSWCKVAWNWNNGFPLELVYDDGEADDLFVFTNPGSLNAVRFTPTSYPCRVAGGQIYVGDGSFPGPFLGTDLRLLIFDDQGEDGLPGNVLDSMTITVDNYDWIEFEGFNVIISGGDFYLAMKQLNPAPDAAPVGVDYDNPVNNRSYTKFLDNPWELSAFQDFMMRAWITGTEPDPSTYTIDRFSDFDPNGSPLLGIITPLDTTGIHIYHDYAWDTLADGWYAYGVKEHYEGGGASDYVISNIAGHFDSIACIPPSCFYQADTGSMPIIICPPLDSTGNVPFNFLGYYIYLDGEEIEVLSPGAVSYQPDCTSPCKRDYGITAVYDLSPFGFPGEYVESEEIHTDYIIRYGTSLPFLENWNYGNFETNNWSVDSTNWSISGLTGHPVPSATFTWDPIQTDYELSLESYPLLADSLFNGLIWLDFEIKLSAFLFTGEEKMFVQVWNWEDQVWNTVDSITNADGSFDWMAEHIDITAYALGQLFKVRFQATGANSLDIVGWYIDNIHVYRVCKAPKDLYDPNTQMGGIEMSWMDPFDFEQWLHWDDGTNYNAFGTGNSVEFDVAARWTPSQLSQFQNGILKEVAFFPNEPAATYSIRIWQGAGAANLILEAPVSDPNIGQWNYAFLHDSLEIDITQELWIGYHVNTTAGYPAGYDNGPANDGFGNMINLGGWKTMLQIDPELNYNWNIYALIHWSEPAKHPDKYAIYRKDDNGTEYSLIGYSGDEFYWDTTVCPPIGWYCYQVTSLYIMDGDTCESGPSNEFCDGCIGIGENDERVDFSIYPNPARDNISIESSETVEVLLLYNYDGRMIFRKEPDEKSFDLSVRDYPEGVYLLRAETSGGIVSRKIVVMR
jgi:hypothetical protein